MNVIAPGFVRSHATRNREYAMPFTMELDDAVNFIRYGLERDWPAIVFPWQTYALVSAFAAVPRNVRDFIARFHIIPPMGYVTSAQPPSPEAVSSPKKDA